MSEPTFEPLQSTQDYLDYLTKSLVTYATVGRDDDVQSILREALAAAWSHGHIAGIMSERRELDAAPNPYRETDNA